MRKQCLYVDYGYGLADYGYMYGDFLRECHITLYTVFLRGYWRLDTLVIIILLMVLYCTTVGSHTHWSISSPAVVRPHPSGPTDSSCSPEGAPWWVGHVRDSTRAVVAEIP